MLTKESYDKLTNILLFENHLKDEKANFLTFCDGYLFRRDDARLVAYETEEKSEKIFSFSLEAFEKDTSFEVQLKSGEILMKNEEKQKTIKSVEVPFESNSINILKKVNFEWEVSIDTKSLAKALMMLQRKLMNQQVDLETVTLELDLKNRSLQLEKDDAMGYDIKCEILKEGEDHLIHYSFLLFKDLLMNAKSFGKQVRFFVEQPYFTRIQYNERTTAVLSHKRKMGEDL